MLSGTMYCKLGEYIGQLRAMERQQETSHKVPMMKELASAAGLTTAGMSNLVRRKTQSLSFKVGAAILTEMRSRGFDTRIDDILGFEVPVFFEDDEE